MAEAADAAVEPGEAKRLRMASEAEQELLKATRLRDRLVTALVHKDQSSLQQVVRTLSHFGPTAETLAASGLGRILGDQSLKMCLDDSSVQLVDMILGKWRALPRDKVKTKPVRYLGRLTVTDFIDRVAEMASWMKVLDRVEGVLPLYKEVACLLVLQGFDYARQLVGVEVHELADVGRNAAEKSLVRRAVEHAQTLSQVAAPRLEAPSKSASSLVELLTEENLSKAEAAWQVEADKLVPGGLASTLRPMQGIRGAEAAAVRGLPITALLEQQVLLLKQETQRKSMPSVASGLRAWHHFAVGVLAYPESQTLPPRSSKDVELFVTLFANGSTAQNYVGYVRWACRYLNVDDLWHDTSLQQTLKGAKKRTLRLTGGSLPTRWRLTEALVTQLVSLADSLGEPLMATAVVVYWEFLFRVASEGIALQAGAATDATSLHPDRHSGMWVDADGALVMRLQRRKHRPQGSLMKRPCLCSERGLARCPPHRVQTLLATRTPGQPMWPWTTAYDFRMKLRRLLLLLGVEGAATVTLKAFRAGKATALVASGCSLTKVLMAGEWKSLAALRYIDEDMVDAARVFDLTLEQSGSEDDR